MARGRNSSLPGVKRRNQKCVRYDNNRGDNFTVYATFGSENFITLMFFHCFIKCYESKARGNPECDGVKKFPEEFQGVMKGFLPVKPLPADFEERSIADKKSALAELASYQAKEAAGVYERNQASVPLNGGCGSGNQLENPEGRPPPFSVQQLIDMLFSELECRASSYSELSLMLLVVKSDLMNWLNALGMKEECLGFDSRSSPIQLPDGTWAKGGGLDASHPQDCGEEVVGAMEKGDKDGLPDVDTSLESVPRLTGRKRANERDVYPPVYNGTEQQQPMKWPMENSMLPSPSGSQLEGIGGEIVGASNSSQIGEHEQLPVYIQQIPDEWDAEQGDDNQTNHLDDMQVEEISATDPVSAGCQVDVRCSLSRNTPEEILPLPQVGERSGVGCDAIYSHPREVCMEGGNREPRSDILEGVQRDTGGNGAYMEDFYEQLSSLEWLAFEQQHGVEKYWTDPYQYFDDLRDQGGVNEGFYSIDTFPA